MLEAKGISFGYSRKKQLFKDFNLQVDRSERLALHAPSGFGKTTLCRILAGYITPTGGTVFLDGKPLPEKGVFPVQMISQHPEAAVDPRLRMEKTLEEAGLVQQRLLTELGIRDEWLTRFPHELSGGELQRFCIARALSAKPSFIIADEISTMLDAVTQAKLWTFLIEEAKRENIGIIFVSHSPALTARIATREEVLTAKQ